MTQFYADQLTVRWIDNIQITDNYVAHLKCETKQKSYKSFFDLLEKLELGKAIKVKTPVCHRENQ